MIRIAILDDYQNVSLEMADWSPLAGRAEITVFNDHLSDPEKVVERLQPFDVVCAMRERTPLSRAVVERLPRLKLIASTGPRNAAIDVEAAAEHGIVVSHTRYDASSTIEMTWALILASMRRVALESANLRAGGWQRTVGDSVKGQILGILGLGNIGSEVARIGLAFGMEVIAWSQNLTAEKAQSSGARLISKEELFQSADIVTIHLVLSSRTKGLVGAADLRAMKPSARLINTSRGPIVDEAALIEVLHERRIAGAALDVFDIEPLPADHPFRTLDNVLSTPHLGYVARDLYMTFYGDTLKNIARWLDLGDARPSNTLAIQRQGDRYESDGSAEK